MNGRKVIRMFILYFMSNLLSMSLYISMFKDAYWIQTYAKTLRDNPLFEVMSPAAVLEFPQWLYVLPLIGMEMLRKAGSEHRKE